MNFYGNEIISSYTRPPHVNFYGNEIISSYTRPLHVNFYGNEIISSYTPSTACELYGNEIISSYTPSTFILKIEPARVWLLHKHYPFVPTVIQNVPLNLPFVPYPRNCELRVLNCFCDCCGELTLCFRFVYPFWLLQDTLSVN